MYDLLYIPSDTSCLLPSGHDFIVICFMFLSIAYRLLDRSEVVHNTTTISGIAKWFRFVQVLGPLWEVCDFVRGCR